MKSKENSQGNKKVKKMGKREKRKNLLDSIRPLVQKEGHKNMSEDDLIIHICESFQRSYVMSDDQYNRAKTLSKELNRTVENIASTYIEYGIKTLEKKVSSLKEEMKKTKKANIKHLNVAGSAQFRIEEAVKKFIKKNEKAKEKDDKLFISQTVLSDETGCNRPAIKGWLEANKELLDKHHTKHGLDELHNRRVTMKRNKLKRLQIGLEGAKDERK